MSKKLLASAVAALVAGYAGPPGPGRGNQPGNSGHLPGLGNAPGNSRVVGVVAGPVGPVVLRAVLNVVLRGRARR